MTEERVFKNHPTTILGNAINAAFLCAFIALLNYSSVSEFLVYVVGLVGVVAVLVALISFYLWKKTTFTFTEEELIVNIDTVFKKVNHIQYAKMASVNVKRSVLNKLFGTSTLTFNINSSVNATEAEAKLTLKKELADDLRNEINSLVFRKEMSIEEDHEVPSDVHITNKDVILHAFLAQSTITSIFGILSTIYAIVMIFYGSTGGLLSAILLFLMGEVIPIISSIMKYYNYRMYRVDDTITVECGLLETKRSSFNINKINSVRIREPLMARSIHMATLEAEVVGIADDESIPLLCPLKPRAEVEALFAKLIPEFYDESMELIHQPHIALVPMTVAQILIAVVVIPIFYLFYTYVWLEYRTIGGFWGSLLTFGFLAAMVLTAIVMVGYVGLAQRHYMFARGRDVFLFVHGSFDVSAEYIAYDKVQYVSVSEGLVARRFGLASCQVNMMSSEGFRGISSGYFRPDDLEAVGNEIISRISDGRYDYRRYY